MYADLREKSREWIGITKEQLIKRLGEPESLEGERINDLEISKLCYTAADGCFRVFLNKNNKVTKLDFFSPPSVMSY